MEYYNEVECKQTHYLLLTKDEQARLEKANNLDHTNSKQVCVREWSSRSEVVPQSKWLQVPGRDRKTGLPERDSCYCQNTQALYGNNNTVGT